MTMYLSDLQPNFTYLTTEDGAFITTEEGWFVVLDIFRETSPYQGSNGNKLLTTSLIVDMNSPGQIAGAMQSAPRAFDRKGRRISWDD